MRAFAAQVIARLRASRTTTIAARTSASMRRCADAARLNVDGGAVRSATRVVQAGARIVLHLLEVLRRKGGGRPTASICIGGGQGRGDAGGDGVMSAKTATTGSTGACAVGRTPGWPGWIWRMRA